MDGPGEPADPDGVDPSAAFFGLWPKFAAAAAGERSDAAAREPRSWVIAHEPPRLRLA